MKIIIRLKEIRRKKNISLKKLSMISGISSTHLNDIENNLKNPSFSIMIRIAISLKVSLNELYIIYYE